MKRTTFMLLSLSIMIGSLVFTSNYGNGLLAAGGSGGKHIKYMKEGEKVPFDRPVEEIQPFIAPMNELNLFPCSDCHDKEWETNAERHKLDEPHDEFPGKFVNHDSDNRWCFDCHSDKNRDKFKLINGKEVPFNEYYRVCEQCHKRVYREWKMGVHGKRTGHWNGKKQWMNCTQCHNPHDPPFKAIEPMPVPRKPENAWIKEEAKKEEEKPAAN